MKIVIVGLGVIGGSFALALQEAGYRDVFGVDIDSDTITKAKTRGLIADGGTDAACFLPEADLVVLALYPTLVIPFVRQYRSCFTSRTVLTDTTGIKMTLIRDIQEILPESVDFVFGHPMAGREKKGIEYASKEVFRGANYLITPTEQNRPENLDLVENLAYELGFGSVRRVAPEQHDEIIGFTSQLPHAMAVALVNSDVEGRDTGRFIGDSYRDLTRIANINADLWSELFLGNRQNLLQAIQHFERELDLIKDAVVREDPEQLQRCFRRAAARRERL